MNKPVAINLIPHAALLDGGREFLRVWMKPDGTLACFLQPNHLGADPAMLGAALVDVVRNGARAWAEAVNIPVDEAAARIWAGLAAERGVAAAPAAAAAPADDDFITYTAPEDPRR